MLFVNDIKRAYIVCTLSALLEEINEGKEVKDIKDRLFSWEKSKFDMEHICAQNIFNQSDSEDIPKYNGIGNLVVLERSINRSIGDKTVDKKVDRYEDSSFVSVRRVAEQIKGSGNVWGNDQVSSRCEKQEKLLCEFLGLYD
ncbi:MAG: HNH endonuclease [Oscillospiraceae bacterium]|nr:HNH endonuclease [Oscillospiraceae bacterium]